MVLSQISWKTLNLTQTVKEFLSCQFQSIPFHPCYMIKPTLPVPYFTTAVTDDIFNPLRGAVIIPQIFVPSKSFLSYGFCYKCHFYFLLVLVQIL